MMPYLKSYLVLSGKHVCSWNQNHPIPSTDFHAQPEPEENFDFTGYQNLSANASPGCQTRMPASPKYPKTYSERAI